MLVAVVLMLFVPASIGDRQAPQPSQRPATSLQNRNDETTAREMADRSVKAQFQPSLDMKEAADFLLTPALLVQESISSGIVLTYPTE